MKITLLHAGQFAISTSESRPEKRKGYRLLRVMYSAICRTDARMWLTGHRDLVLPRVLGHEIAAIDETTGELFTVWPGQECGHCPFCLSHRENLCDGINIIGFHVDGGWADYISVPETSLILAPQQIENALYLCFAEPMACVVNALKAVGISTGTRIVIYGGGVVGLLAGMICRRKGGCVTIIEKAQAKMQKAQLFTQRCGVTLRMSPAEDDFDVAINCCDSHEAFSQCILRLKKGGHLCYFSGLQKNTSITTDILNHVHYKEIVISGSYGPRKKDMQEVLQVCCNEQHLLALLIEDIIVPQNVERAIHETAQGNSLKYIIDFQRY